MKNTTINRVKFYSQYLFTNTKFRYQEILWDGELVNKEAEINFSTLTRILSHSDIDGRFVNKVRNGFIELTPISEITDEHAIEVAVIYGFEGEDITLIKLGKEVIYHFRDDYKDEYTFDIMCAKSTHDVIDFVRDRGYAVRYRGLSVEQQVDYNWVKLKTE